MTRGPIPTIALSCSVVFLTTVGAALLTRAQSAPAPAPSPGALADGSTLLPNGWRLAPAGRHLTVGDLPLNVVQSPDSRYLIITNNGLAKPSFSVVDVASWTIKNTTQLESAWYGLVWHPDGTKLYSAGDKAREVEQIVDHAHHRRRAAMNLRRHLVHLLRRGRTNCQQFGVAMDERERRPQLVRDG